MNMRSRIGSLKHDDLVLAVAIALWRAHGDNVPGWGILEYYRRLATETPRTVAPSVSSPECVVLRAPAGTSTVYGMSGRSYAVDERGRVTVTADDAEPLIRNGWQRALPPSTNETNIAS
jgi:hypothetical protein